MPEISIKTVNVYRVDGKPVAGWCRKGSQWISFSIGEDGSQTKRIKWGDDEGSARGFAKNVAYRRAGRYARVTLNDEE